MSELNLTDSNFEQEVINSDKPVLVDFFADWCGPCRMQGPIVEELAGEVGDKVKVFKMDVDANPETAQKFGIMSIPTLIFFKDGKAVETLNGVNTKDTLMQKINSLV